MKAKTIIEYILAAVLVLILGGLSGWFFFLRGQSQTTTTGALARGYGAEAPTGNAGGSVFGTAAQTGTKSSEPSSARPPQLWHVLSKPVAGLAFVGSGKAARLRYVERATGYVFDADPETGNVTRLTNTLNPKIYEAIITPHGHVIERSLDDARMITTFVGTISTSTPGADSATSTQSLAGLYLAKNILQIVTDPKSDGLFYLLRDGEGIIGVRSEWNGTKQKTVFTSSIAHWRLMEQGSGRIILASAALNGVPGYAYELNADGSLSPIIGAVPGLTLLPHPGVPATGTRKGGSSTSNALLWGETAGSVMSLYAKASAGASAARLPVQTIADKCAWSPASSGAPAGTPVVAYCAVPQTAPVGNFLDEWYRGDAHSSDALWRVDALAGTAELVYSPGAGTSVDVINPTVDTEGEYVAFMNAADQSLWLLRLTK